MKRFISNSKCHFSWEWGLTELEQLILVLIFCLLVVSTDLHLWKINNNKSFDVPYESEKGVKYFASLGSNPAADLCCISLSLISCHLSTNAIK